MISVIRNLPVILLAVVLGAALYVAYTSYNTINSRVDHISQELYYNINSVNELSARLSTVAELVGAPPLAPKPGSGSGSDKESVEGVLEVGSQGSVCDISPDDAESVAAEDVRVVSSGDAADPDAEPFVEVLQSDAASPPPPSPRGLMLSRHQELDSFPPEAPAADPEEDISTYIGQLEKYVKSSDDTESIGSEVSSVSQLTPKRRVPPYSAKTVELGTTVEWDGGLFSSIKTKSGSTRWSKKMPLTGE